ncbi:hypothetical protein [Aeromicrobium sp.]|uniref:hypothetical protein n=1 Tax=Aeromicrobium sp. TaxID=1871063 RepID=UPI0030C476C6
MSKSADTVDLKKSLDAYQARRGEFRILNVPAMQYLMIDGQGDPNTSRKFADAIATLFPVAYALKFASKRELGRDHVVVPLEGPWWPVRGSMRADAAHRGIRRGSRGPGPDARQLIPDNGMRMTGKHHEVYLSDSRRGSPERLRTILRQPVAPVESAGLI